MPFEQSYLSAPERAEYLNSLHRGHAAIPILRDLVAGHYAGRMALVSSFGAEAVVLLHMVATVKPDLDVLFIDTQMLFPETLAYQQEVAKHLGLTNVKVINAAPQNLAVVDSQLTLYRTNPDACCSARKAQPLQHALMEYDTWITGRKRFQSKTRQSLNLFEAETETRMKVNPLVHWRPTDVRDYIENNALPRHPLVAQGFPSIGCMPCTKRVEDGADARSGRWSGQEKTECGIHFGPNGSVRGAKT